MSVPTCNVRRARFSGSADATYSRRGCSQSCAVRCMSGGSARSGGVVSSPKPGASQGKYIREYRPYGVVLQLPTVFMLQSGITNSMPVPSAIAAASEPQRRVRATRRSTYTPIGSAYATAVSGRVKASQATQAATTSSQRSRFGSSVRQRRSAYQPSSQTSVDVDCEKYDAVSQSTNGEPIQTVHVHSATTPLASRRAI